MLIIHHWDTDGITSAALMIKILNLDNFVNITPPIGNFEFDDRISSEIEKSESVCVLDLNLPHEVENVKDKDVLFIDHHIQKNINRPNIKQINPVLDGKEFPSASFVVSDHYSYWDYLSALGAIGDIGDKAFAIPKVKKLLDSESINKEEALKLVNLIDSNYIIMDRTAVEKAVNTVIELSPRDLLNYEEWNKNLDSINGEIQKAIDGMETISVKNGNIAYIEYENPFNIISKIARKTVWDLGYDGAIVVNKDFHGDAQLYFRISSNMADKIDVPNIIKSMKNRGYNVGGKKEVLGCICKKEDVNTAIELIHNHL